MQSCRPAPLLLVLVCLQPLAWAAETTVQAARLPAPWKGVLERLRADRDRLSGRLETAHETLLSRARKDQPDLVERLSPEPPAARPTGYCVLPEIEGDPPLAPVEPKETVYSMESLGRSLHRDLIDARALIDREIRDPVTPLKPQVEEFERLRDRLESVEEHVEYHAQWQQAVGDQAEYFAMRNRLVLSVREWRRQHAADETTSLDKTTLRAIAPFNVTEGLSIEETESGDRVLAVTVWTDIEDRDLVAAFRQGVEANFTRSETRFRLALDVRTVTPDALYPEGPPEKGADIDLEHHLARFPEGSLVLTTGAESTHAWQGRYVVLGSAPLSRRVLAHEFGHLLGFSDAYLRGFDGDPGGPYGVTLVEWTGLVDDLMGNSDTGRVTEAMIDTLIEAYAHP